MIVLDATEVDEVLRAHPSLPLRAVHDAYAAELAGTAASSQPPLLRLPLPDGARFQAKAARFGEVVGVRIAGERDGRQVDDGRRLLLYRLEDFLPWALVDERRLYRVRVAAQIAATVRVLARRRGRVVVVGTGRLAREVVRGLDAAAPFTVVALHGRDATRRDRAVERLDATVAGRVRGVTDLATSVAAADVVVTMSTAETPVVAGRDLSPGTLVVSAGGGWECDAAVYARARRVFLDDPPHCRQIGDLAGLEAAGHPLPNVTATLPDVVAGAGAPPCGADEIVVAVAQGMTACDVAIATAVVDRYEPGAWT